MQPTESGCVVVYDGNCPFCRRQVDRIRRRDARAIFSYLPRQTPGLTERFPRLAEQDFNTGMRLIAPEGIVHLGADAVYHIARRLPGWRRWAWLYQVPGLHALFRAAYAWVAAHRMSLSGACPAGSCAPR